MKRLIVALALSCRAQDWHSSGSYHEASWPDGSDGSDYHGYNHGYHGSSHSTEEMGGISGSTYDDGSSSSYDGSDINPSYHDGSLSSYDGSGINPPGYDDGSIYHGGSSSSYDGSGINRDYHGGSVYDHGSSSDNYGGSGSSHYDDGSSSSHYYDGGSGSSHYDDGSSSSHYDDGSSSSHYDDGSSSSHYDDGSSSSPYDDGSSSSDYYDDGSSNSHYYDHASDSSHYEDGSSTYDDDGSRNSDSEGVYQDTAWIVAGSRACSGNEVEWDQCHDSLPSCDHCSPQDCQFAEWGQWYDAGGCTGICFRHRALAQPNNECGRPCVGVQEDTKPCIKSSCAPASQQDAMFSSWTQWTPCNAGQQERHRYIAQDASHGGRSVVGHLREVQPCGLEEIMVNCEFNQWNSWTECSATCGRGWHTRDRRIVRFSSGGGRPCIGSTREEHPCAETPCAAPQCTFSAWSSWTGCDSMRPYQKTRERHVDVPGTDGCDGALQQLAACATRDPADCVLGQWDAWSECDKQCGGGQMYRERKMLVEAHRGGTCQHSSLKQVHPCNEHDCETHDDDCILSPWESWSTCTAQCEDGVTKRHRKIQQRAREGGQPCKGSMMEVESCKGPGCEQRDCVWGQWDAWSGCSCTCGGGTMRRNRQVQVSPVAGGALCDPVDKSEAAPCNTFDCEESCVDARWAEWTSWTACSASCGYGFRSRHRSHAVQASSCGRAATGHPSAWEVCKGTHLGSAACRDRDGRLSAWNSWSDCSCTCFGIRERQRIIEQYHTGQGKPVGFMPLKQMEPCHPSYGEQPPSECVHHHHDCVLSQWNEWTECPVTCGGGNAVRLRYIFTPASNDGRPCEASLRETKPCGTNPCGSGCVDCLWGAWAEWGACSKCGDQRFRQRDILKLPNHCGKMCEPRVAKEVQNCTSQCEKYSFCVWKQWTSWSGCSANCGPATRLRERSLGLVMDQPSYFLFKVAADTNAGLCAGTQTDTEACPTEPCSHQCVPQDCQFSAWGPWHQPSCIGLCTRARSIKVMNNECGHPCQGPLVGTKRCLEECTEVRDCEFRAWSHWTQSDSVGDGGQRYRSREVSQLPKNGGQLCRGDLREVDGTGHQDDSPQDCVLMQWSAWAGCTKTCGGGWQLRQRDVEHPAAHGGRACLGDLSEGRPCGTYACEDSDCTLGAWSSWTSCYAGGGQRIRSRTITRPASSGGMPCGAGTGSLYVPLKETVSCGAAQTDCEVSPWSGWDACDRSCGPGQQQRHRQVQQYPIQNGLPCPVSLRELRACEISQCNSVNCEATSWGEWGTCSVECGSGQQSRDRQIARPAVGEGTRCDFSLSETRACSDRGGGSMPNCGVVNCVWGSWSSWSGCTCSCGGGQRTRNRHIAQTPQNGGGMCEPMHKEEIDSCNTHSCMQSTCRDGAWGMWQEWSHCSSSCRGGLRYRHRRMETEANECGTPAEGLSRAVESCNEHLPCSGDVDCAFDSWTQWSACTRTCDGIKRRSRRISVYGHGNGKYCMGALKETSPCHPDPGMSPPEACRAVVDQDCEMGEWTQWGACDATCGGGQRTRSRSVDREARGRGLTCHDSLTETHGCAEQDCHVDGTKVNCEWSEWSQWGACNKCGGQRVRFRHVVREPNNGGLPCELKAAEETGKCPRKCHESMYCVWEHWESWSECSTSCGTGGVRHRQRGLALKSHDEIQALGLLYEAPVEPVAAQPWLLSQGVQLQLVLAFAGGIIATMAVGHVSRNLSWRYGESLPFFSQIQLASQEGLNRWRHNEAQNAGYMPVSTTPSDLDA